MMGVLFSSRGMDRDRGCRVDTPGSRAGGERLAGRVDRAHLHKAIRKIGPMVQTRECPNKGLAWLGHARVQSRRAWGRPGGRLPGVRPQASATSAAPTGNGAGGG